MPEIRIAPQPGQQEKFLRTNADIAIYGGAAGGGKAQPLDEPVLTPFGFKPMGDIKVGSKVVTAKGTTATVIQIHPQGRIPIYKIKFIDGAETRCSAEHLWLAKISCVKGKVEHCNGWKIYDTKRLCEKVKSGVNMLTPLCEPVQFTRGKRCGVIKPYTLGVLLGDDCCVASDINVTGNDRLVFDEIRKDGYELSEYNGHASTLVCAFKNFKKEKSWLKANNLLCKSEDKYIPESYLYGTTEERYALIQGLMDIDGYADVRGHCEYCTISKRLAENMQWLIRSIGGKATISEKIPVCVDPDGNRKECKKAYIVYIMTKDNSKLFRLERKVKRCEGKKYNGGYSELSRRILSIEECGEAECQCITIDEPDGLYVTKDFIVTHNSYALLLTALRYTNIKGFGATIFRRNYNQIFAEGGLWDEASGIYSNVNGARPRMVDGSWIFADSTGATLSRVKFAHLERDDELKNWQGSQICYIGYDELTHFSKKQFFYMLSRNRSTCGVKPFIRATCNPDADSWVAEFIEWWIDQDTGYPIPERSGVKRYFYRGADEAIIWADTKKELYERFDLVKPEDKAKVKSCTFIMATIYDNQALLKVDPAYLGNLEALPLIERERLLYGNWKIKAAAGLYFKRNQVGNILEVIPDDVIQWVRCWDLAASEEDKDGDPAYTAGVLIGKRKNGRYVVADVVNERLSASEVRNLIRLTAQRDRAQFKRVRIRLPQDPGQAGKEQAQSYIKFLSGFDVTAVVESGSKESRAEPMAAQWQAGNFDIVNAAWNDPYLLQLENFPEGKFKDMVDASANGFTEIELKTQFNVSNLL